MLKGLDKMDEFVLDGSFCFLNFFLRHDNLLLPLKLLSWAFYGKLENISRRKKISDNKPFLLWVQELRAALSLEASVWKFYLYFSNLAYSSQDK